MADRPDNKWRFIESEMNRFEAEISSLARQPNFIPAQLRRPPGPNMMGGPTMIASPPVMHRPRGPAPSVISGAPQKYTTSSDSSSSTKPVTSTVTQAAPLLQPQPIIRPMIPPQVHPLFPQPSAMRPLGNPPGAPPLTVPQPSIIPGSLVPVGPIAGTSSLALPSSSAEPNNKPTIPGETGSEKPKSKNKKKKDDGKPKKSLRSAGGQIWEDSSLADWDTSDFRLFCGDLGNDVTDEVLTRVFGRYPSFQKAKVIRDKRTNKTKGYGFVSFKDPADFVRSIRELDGRYVGSRPIKLRKSNWKNRNLDQARKRDRERNQLIGIVKKTGKR